MDINKKFLFDSIRLPWGEGTDDMSVAQSEPFPADSSCKCGRSVLPLQMKGKYVSGNTETNILPHMIFSVLQTKSFVFKVL